MKRSNFYVLNQCANLLVLSGLIILFAQNVLAENLSVEHWVKSGSNGPELYLEVRNSKFDRVGARIKTSGTSHFETHEFEKSLKDGVWRLNVKNIHPNDKVEFAVFGDDIVSGDRHWDNNEHKNFVIHIPKHKNQHSEPSRIQSKSSSSHDQPLSSEKEIRDDISTQQAEVRKINKRKDLLQDPLVKNHLSKHPVFVSLTTSPDRLKYLDAVLDTVDLDPVKEVLLVLPKKFGRDGKIYDESLKEKLVKKYHPKVKIISPEEDEGPISKLLPAAEYAKKNDPKSVVITLDDDCAYPPGMVSELIAAAVTKNNTVISGSGEKLSKWGVSPFGFPKTSENDPERMHLKNEHYSYVDVVEGIGGIAYQADLVDVDLMRSLAKISKNCKFSDDLVISFALAMDGINRMKLNKNYTMSQVRPFRYGNEAGALHLGAGLSSTVTEDDFNPVKYHSCYDDLMNLAFDTKKMQLRTRDELLMLLNATSQAQGEKKTEAMQASQMNCFLDCANRCKDFSQDKNSKSVSDSIMKRIEKEENRKQGREVQPKAIPAF